VSQKRKVTLYFNSVMLAETQKEAIRQDRSVSWIIQAAWRIARDEVRRMPASGVVVAPAVVAPTVVAPSAGPDIRGEGPLVLPSPTDTRWQA
jgi:uncharacterized small protein (TIGR04563 family)